MIDWNKTTTQKEYFDKYPKSHKKVLRVCDICGKEKLVDYANHKFLICHPCSLLINDKFNASGKNHPFYGKHHSDESKDKMSESLTGLKRTDEQKKNYRNSKMGDKNPQYGMTGELSQNYGKMRLIESKIKQSCSMQDIDIKEFGGFIGRHSKRSYVLPEEKCIKLNDKFKGSHFHHILKDLGIYIPSELHNHIKHDIRKGENMGEMNVLAIQFINGGLNE